jgi:hypothetical protein
LAVELTEFEQPTDRRRERLAVILVGGFSKRLQGAVQEFVDHPIDGLKDFLVGPDVDTAIVHQETGRTTMTRLSFQASTTHRLQHKT